MIAYNSHVFSINSYAITLYTEAMKYAKVQETLWEGKTMAIAAANRYIKHNGTQAIFNI